MSSSFLMREVMSKPRKGFCSCSLVPGDTLLSFSSASRPSGGEAGDFVFLAESPSDRKAESAELQPP